jgi:phage recombination protein Bet
MSNEIAVTYNIGDEEIRLTPKIVKDYLAGGAEITMPEFKMFTSLCKARGLNPFLKEAYIIKFGDNPAQIVVGKDAILKRAILNAQFDGREQGVIVIDSTGKEIHKQGTFILQDETIVGGWAKVYRKDWTHPVHITVSLSEVAQRKGNGEFNFNWAKKTATMIEKVALVRALREAFVEEAGGMYDANELPDNEVITNDDALIEDAEIVEQPDTLEDGGDESETVDINNL